MTAPGPDSWTPEQFSAALAGIEAGFFDGNSKEEQDKAGTTAHLFSLKRDKLLNGKLVEPGLNAKPSEPIRLVHPAVSQEGVDAPTEDIVVTRPVDYFEDKAKTRRDLRLTLIVLAAAATGIAASVFGVLGDGNSQPTPGPSPSIERMIDPSDGPSDSPSP